jgi:Fur family peroxide stress response transcriptional regulator
MEKYRERGLKLTPQRIAIFDYLEGNKDHPSADDIYRAVAKRFPTMSFATVYNTLAALRERGSLQELTIDPAKKRYDPDTERHNHLICIECRRVVDVFRIYDLDLPSRFRHDFTVLANHVEFHGLCGDCKRKNDK